MKIVSIKDNHVFQKLYHAKFAAGSMLVTYCAKSRFPGVRVGITTGKKLGGAVQRNRCRRIIRAAFRELPPFTGRWDIVFVAREKTVSAKTGEILREMRGQLRKLGILEKPSRDTSPAHPVPQNRLGQEP